ncbi:MAG: hypothetical protein ACREQQ_00920 [Candidatus Binatia bacterium]
MTDRAQRPRTVHLVGSIPLADAETVFRTVARTLGETVSRIPDGETGPRLDWIIWQLPVLTSRPQLELVPPDPARYAPNPTVRLRPSASARDIRFERLGYADAARESYATFARLQRDGVIPERCRFQVSLPTPLAPIAAFVADAHVEIEALYEERLLAEVGEIVRAIPKEALAIQWDVAVEMALWERSLPAFFDDVERGIIERLVRIGGSIPAGVELGYHLCYGDYEHQHFKQPENARQLVKVANALSAGVRRRIDWIHMPVPRDRTDSGYFEPLRELRLRPETQLFLGLVHFTDGAEGTRKRISVAERVVSGFGIATECGLGRRRPDTLEPLLGIHAEVARSA